MIRERTHLQTKRYSFWFHFSKTSQILHWFSSFLFLFCELTVLLEAQGHQISPRNDITLSERSEQQLAASGWFGLYAAFLDLSHWILHWGACLSLFFASGGFSWARGFFSRRHSAPVRVLEWVLSTHQKHSFVSAQGFFIWGIFLAILGIPTPQLTLPNKAISPEGRPSSEAQKALAFFSLVSLFLLTEMWRDFFFP